MVCRLPIKHHYFYNTVQYNTTMRLPFDAHNHIHMGPSPPVCALLSPAVSPAVPVVVDNWIDNADDNAVAALDGLAIMSTHPRDFDDVMDLSKSLPRRFPGVHIVPCFGVHPWFLHELEDSDWEEAALAGGGPMWIREIERRLLSTPGAIVGEVGLDGFHFDAKTGELVSPMEKQVEAFEAQMQLAAKLQKPVSVHTVQCFGHLMASLSKLKKSKLGLPPKVYFHAFGGKLGTIDQLSALCGRNPPGRLYFGFAPVVNFRSPKTPHVIQKVGIDRLVLETDHEDARRVPESMETGIQTMAEILGVTKDYLIERTTQNAHDLYGLSSL